MAQNLQTNIVINAKTGSGFSQVGNTLTELGSMVDGVSQKLINFGKDSINVYKDYEKSLKEAEVALATAYGQGSTELANVMKIIDVQATEWAASSIFHTDDVANAIAEAARAGWDLKNITSGIPAAMRLAQAGSLDLSEAVNYIVKSTNAAGISFDDLGVFIDEWSYSANKSATTIEEMGDAMLRMGRTMNFADSKEEVFAMLSALANVGYVGQEAGTVLRNAMLRLAAPTAKAADAMESLEITQEELEEILSDDAIITASETLTNLGFSAYDSEGNLRSMVDIYGDLNKALSQLSEEEVNSIMSAIFPSRTLAAGIALVEGAADGYDGLFDSLKNGVAEGYGEYASSTMMDTLNGDIETFISKYERLHQVVGASISDDVSTGLDFLGGFIDSLATMDPAQMDAVTGGLEVVAALGPGLMIAGTALRLMGNKFNLYALGLAGVLGAVRYISELRQADFEGIFGDQDLDAQAMSTYISELGSAYEMAYSNVDKFSASLDTAVESYKTASGTFSSKLLTLMLTDATLTEEDITNLENLGKQMQTSVLAGIGSSADANAAFLEAFFGVDHGGSLDTTTWNDIISTSSTWYANLESEALAIGEGLTAAMTAAFEDGQLSSEERADIMAWVADYNETITKAQREWEDMQTRANLEKTLWKSQNASWDSVLATSQEIDAMRSAQRTELEDSYGNARAIYKIQKEDEIAGTTSEALRLTLTQEMNSTLSEMDAQFNAELAAIDSQFAEFGYNLYDSAIRSSDVSDGYAYLMNLGEALLNGDISQVSARNQYLQSGYADMDLVNSLIYAITSFGGLEEAIALYSSTKDSGNAELANKIGSMIMAYGVSTDYHDYYMDESDILTRFISGNDYMLKSNYASAVPTLFSEGMGTAIKDKDLQFYADISQAEESINNLSAEPITIDVDGDTGLAMAAIKTIDGTSINVVLRPDSSAMYSSLNALAQYASSINVGGGGNFTNRNAAYAEGGRATEASIFGEAGPEWAIPEEHSQRTADLLTQAAKASGFTWPELLGMRDGFNNASKGKTTTIVYSPTINANDASGISQVLKNDKIALMRLLAEHDMIRDMEVYA